MQDKHSVKCSFCDNVVSTTLSAVICPDCLKVDTIGFSNYYYSLSLLRIVLDVADLSNLNQLQKNTLGLGTRVAMQYLVWTVGLRMILILIEEVDEDITDYDSTIKSKNKKTRKILTGNSTYLFYDTEKDEKSPTEFMSEKDVFSHNPVPVKDSGRIDEQHFSFQVVFVPRCTVGRR